MKCDNFERLSNSVDNQYECQTLCELHAGCIAILYSHQEGETEICYSCDNDILTTNQITSDKEYGFYRKPGKIRL